MIWSKLPKNANSYPFIKSVSALTTNPGGLAGYLGFCPATFFPGGKEHKANYLLTRGKGKEENSNPGTQVSC